MSRKLMQRSFTTSTVEFSIVEVENGKLEQRIQNPIELPGDLSAEKATTLLKRKEEYKGLNLVVTKVTPKTALYTMPVEQFLELAAKSEPTQTEED